MRVPLASTPKTRTAGATRTMLTHLDGKTVPKRIDTGVHLVTKENMSDPARNKLLHPSLSILSK